MDSISDIIGKIIRNKGRVGKTRGIDDIEAVWYKAVAGNVAEHSYVVKVHGNMLTVRVDSRCYLAEIKRKEREILAVMQDYGWGRIKKINCRIG